MTAIDWNVSTQFKTTVWHSHITHAVRLSVFGMPCHKYSYLWSKHLKLTFSSVQYLCSFAHLNFFLSLAVLRCGFYFATMPRSPASWICLLTGDAETGLLWALFNEPAGGEPVRHLFLKLDTNVFVLFLTCAVGLLLFFLFWLQPVCTALWRK